MAFTHIEYFKLKNELKLVLSLLKKNLIFWFRFSPSNSLKTFRTLTNETFKNSAKSFCLLELGIFDFNTIKLSFRVIP